jgi:hypothetical protein
MATRPVFIPQLSNDQPAVRTVSVSFTWHPGLAPARKRLNVAAMHAAISATLPELRRPLEASSKSQVPLGVSLSAFNLSVASPRASGVACVESLYQASKVFAAGGPYPQLYTRPAREVRQALKRHAGQPLVAFELHGVRWPLEPPQAFYCWVYCQALHRNPRLAAALDAYDCFTDIEFNPARSVNCQAYAVALYAALARGGRLAQALAAPAAFLALFGDRPAAGTPKSPVMPLAAAPAVTAVPLPSRPVQVKARPARARKGRKRTSVVGQAPTTGPVELPLLESIYPAAEEPEST